MKFLISNHPGSNKIEQLQMLTNSPESVKSAGNHGSLSSIGIPVDPVRSYLRHSRLVTLDVNYSEVVNTLMILNSTKFNPDLAKEP